MTVSEIQDLAPSSRRQPIVKPRRFGRYLLIDQISKGGMSDIFLAKTTSVGGFQKPVVIKKLLPEYSNKPRFVKRFINEAKTLAQLNHSNIVQVLDMGIIDREYYIAMEYVEGRNVAHVLSKATRTAQAPSLAFVIHVVMETAKGLAYAHRKTGPAGVSMMLVHQDVNSFNVMVSYEAEVKIIDFGIAQIFLDQGKSELPVAGKLLYFSPEQLQRKPIDRRVDIYGTGVLMYELLVGERLIQHQATVADTIRTILEMDVAAKVNSNDKIPPALKPILTKAVALDPEDRYPWMEDLILDLREAVKELAVDLDPASLATYMKDQFQRERTLDRRRMRRLLTEGFTPLRRSSRTKTQGSEVPEPARGNLSQRTLDSTAWPFYQTGLEMPSGEESEHRIIVAKAGQVIYRQGDLGSDLYVIRYGKVRLFLRIHQKKRTLAVLGEGDFFGETALLADRRRPCWAQAEEESELTCLSRESFEATVGSGLSYRIIASMGEKMGDTISLLEGALHADPLTRLIHALLFICRRSDRSNGTQASFGDLEDWFQLERDFLVQKYLNKLADLGVVEETGTTILLKDVGKLESILNVLRGSGKLTLKL